MNDIIPKSPITIREANLTDIPFIDALQKKHSKQVGWMPTKQLEGKIAAKQVILAEMLNDECRMMNQEAEPFTIHHSQFRIPLGYCIAHDQYFEGDDVGIIYQMNVVPGHQRGLIGASLLKAQFERSAWGCRLYCCWCAQDIAANRFWEAMGFVPLAFRAGSEKKSRVHIFWQRRIRSGDVSTPYWFPAQTSGGSIREDRLVLPIPPGTHWNDAKPMVLPTQLIVDSCQLIEGTAPTPLDSARDRPARQSTGRGSKPATPLPQPGLAGKLLFAPAKAETAKPKTAATKEPKKKRKNDPALVTAARELRDRWLEQVNSVQLVGAGKYDVAREIAGEMPQVKQIMSIAA